MSAMVKLSGVTRSFGSVEAVRGLDLTVERGEILAFLGPSGCGKTTTLRLIAGFEQPDSGEIEVAGEKVAAKETFIPPEKRRVGMVFQDYALFPHLSVERNIAYGLEKKKQRESRVEEVLELTHLEGLADRMPHELSGGQQQRVALARALAPEPAVILLDEPFSNLDAALRARVRREMRGILDKAHVTAVFVTHDQEEALSLADRVAVMFDGRAVQTAPPEDLYHNPATREVAAFVGEANFLAGVARNGTVECSLGRASVKGDLTSEVEVMVRPEAVRLKKEPGGAARVIGREFHGHDQLVRLALDSGEEVVARLGSGHAFRPGDRISVCIAGDVVVFPATDDARE